MRLFIIFLLVCYIVSKSFFNNTTEYSVNLIDQDTVEVIKEDGTRVYVHPDSLIKTIDLDNL